MQKESVGCMWIHPVTESEGESIRERKVPTDANDNSMKCQYFGNVTQEFEA